MNLSFCNLPYILHRDAGAGVHDEQLLVRYKLLDAPGDLHVGAAGLAGVWDEIDDVQDLVGIGCGQLDKMRDFLLY